MGSEMDDSQRIFICTGRQCFTLGGKGREIGVYTAGMLFALSCWMFVDGLLFSSTLPNRVIPPGFEDWAPGIVAILGMITQVNNDNGSINLIDKEALNGDEFDGRIPWRARLILFLGFAMLGGGVAGSVTVLIVKYTIHDLTPLDYYLGIMEVIQCTLIMMRSQPQDQYHYI
ncbi:uncharacterized protein BYT42DRAFT_616960 [Radiomyces spectabilis]|uniref:uncharacterized protein n=1 Tax=Radiomyces spectabilis TaxID=64574 RepID=UPI00221F3685|nr:uncharacterized protein BYT42DRAFT_616960 [Radiomyces spectabilis]KAI8370408.1 hypothetical protein BYT42DRAFT_616960 [Radiomyces spectabilis]